jgi:hypothetical protein
MSQANELYVDALRAAAKLIRPNRKRMTPDEAQRIIRRTFEERGLNPSDDAVSDYVRALTQRSRILRRSH